MGHDRRKQAELERQARKQQWDTLGKLMNDTRGQKLEIGQIVDLQMIGMFRGRVIQVNENTIAPPGQPPMPPHIIVDIQIPKFMTTGQELQTIYIVQDAPKAVTSGVSID